MAHSLRHEIKQNKQFRSRYEEAVLNIARTSNILSNSMEKVFRPHGITATQYNVLRILRGSEPDGLCRNEIRDRMLNRMPDVTRLLDRMEEAGLINRVRDSDDRRLVTTRVTKTGRKLVDGLDEEVENENRRRLGHLTEHQLKTLIGLLTEVRFPE
ncbi:MAG: MarR family transcriptional regulator [Gemmatimonadaceae bacterium]